MSILSTVFKAKRYIKTDNGYQLFSEWQKASEVEFNNGSDAETTLGAINGITSSLNTNNDNYALSAAGGYNLQSQLTKLNTNLKNAIIVKTYTKRLELAANEYFAVRVTAPSVEGYKCIASCYCSQVNGNNTKSYIYFSDYSEKNNNLAIENLLSQKNVSEHKIVFIYTEQ